MSMPRILIVSASAGSGHVRAGDALRAAFAADGAAAEHVDVLTLAPRWVRTAYAGGFELIASRAPGVWREIYERSDGPDGDAARWGATATRVLFRAFRRLLVDGRFDACVCTHFLPGQLTAGRPELPAFSTVITDYAVHRYWVQPRVGRYFVAHPGMAQELAARLPNATVHVTGIPVHADFGTVGAERARETLGLDPRRPVVLVMGGAFGLGVEAAARSTLAAQVAGLQVVAVCGRNDAARQRLTREAATREASMGDLIVRGFIPDIATHMAAADLVITKPGGLTTSEALAMGRPLLLTRGMPGHEEANVRHLTGVCAALAAMHDGDVMSQVRAFFTDPGLRRTLTAGARAAAAPAAATRITRTVLGSLGRRLAA